MSGERGGSSGSVDRCDRAPGDAREGEARTMNRRALRPWLRANYSLVLIWALAGALYALALAVESPR